MLKSIFESWKNRDGNINKTIDLLNWITELNKTTFVKITSSEINEKSFWFYDKHRGIIKNNSNSFFIISGIRKTLLDNQEEQPIIVQDEIGYLGIICKKIDGVLNFLMQAKIEPGNVNVVQLSPTIQATKSNFTRRHGGKIPAYFDFFAQANKYNILYDQLQSEQASRFYKKRNRNIIIEVGSADVPVLDNFKWMTLGQIKELMKIDNLVNMDTRTVLSGLLSGIERVDCDTKNSLKEMFANKSRLCSMVTLHQNEIMECIHVLNDFKMFFNESSELIPLYELNRWSISNTGITPIDVSDFEIGYFDVQIDGREVTKWSQPLVKARGRATFALVFKEVDGVEKYLVRITPEIGSFDKAEFGPSLQLNSSVCENKMGVVEKRIIDIIHSSSPNVSHFLLSEEGGRFFHEENNNYLIRVDSKEMVELPADYLWVSLSTLLVLVQNSNLLNIQLRNLLSLIDIN